jgi:hypothetical protein
MIKRSTFLFFIFTACAILAGFDWPLEKNRIVVNFCESTADGFKTGITFSGNDEAVHPIADGDIVFYHEEGETFSTVPYGLGSFCAILHEGGIQSVYSHLGKGSLKKDTTKVARTDVIGRVGNTGSAAGNNLFLQIFNVEDNEILNPVKYLTPLAKDARAPVIRTVLIRRDNIAANAESVGTITPGTYEIFIGAYDTTDDLIPRVELVPYRISVSNNGNETSNITFQALEDKAGALVTFRSEKSHDETYDSAFVYRLGTAELVEGKNHIQVIVSDFIGNQAVKDIILEVKK